MYAPHFYHIYLIIEAYTEYRSPLFRTILIGLTTSHNLPPSEANKGRKEEGSRPHRSRPANQPHLMLPTQSRMARQHTHPIGNAATLIGSQADFVAKRAIQFLLGVF